MLDRFTMVWSAASLRACSALALPLTVWLITACTCSKPSDESAVPPKSAAGASSQSTAKTRPPKDFFTEVNLKRFIGRPVQELVSAFPVAYDDTYPLDEPPGKLQGMAFTFPSGYVVDVYAAELKYLTKFREKRDWDLQTFLRETITNTRLRYYGH